MAAHGAACIVIWKDGGDPSASRRVFKPPAWPGKLTVVLRMASLDPMTVPMGAALIIAALAGAPVRAEAMTRAESDRVRLELRGHVAPRCSLSGASPSLDISDLIEAARGGELRMPFKINCNTPFGFAMSSDDGAIRASAAPVPGLAGEVPYLARLSILTDSGAKLSLDCASAALGPAGSECRGHSGDETAIEKDGVLVVSWARPNRPLAAGRYETGLRIHLDMGN